MVARCICTSLVILRMSVSGVAGAEQQLVSPDAQQACAAAIPLNVEAGVLAPDVLALLRSSNTFRGQCQRIGRNPDVRLTIAVVGAVDSGRAETVIRRYRTGTIRAEVSVQFGENYDELLAHEFEHVIEQMDGVDLRAETADGRAWLLPSGAFETRRAFAAGVQVLRETGSARVHAPSLPVR
jgi:hypothetical protein